MEPKYIMSEPAKQRRESGKFMGSEYSMDSDLRSSISSTKSRPRGISEKSRRGISFQPAEERYEIVNSGITDSTNRRTGEFVMRRGSKPSPKDEEKYDVVDDVITDSTNRKTGEFVVRRSSKPVLKDEEFKDVELTVKVGNE